MKPWQHICGEPWAITEPALQSVMAIAERQHDKLDALAAKSGQPLEHSHQVEVRDGVAIIPVIGPLFRYANMFTRISGATSYELLAKDITLALESDEVQAMVLSIDSPGGEVNGCAELASLIFNARGKKPLIAYAAGDAASGAYWIASACDEIVVSSTSMLGSIGVVAVYQYQVKDNNRIELVSSQSPHKRLDPSNDNDKGKLQARIDDLAAVFISSVARYRGVDAPTVEANFGGGDVFVGQHAVSQGLADRAGSLEGLIQSLVSAQDASYPLAPHFNTHVPISTDAPIYTNAPISTHSREDSAMSDTKANSPTSKNRTSTVALSVEQLKAEHPALVETLVTEAKRQAFEQGREQGHEKGTAQERERIGAILRDPLAAGREPLAQHLAFTTDMPPEMAAAALKVAPKAEAAASASHITGFDKAMAQVTNPRIAPAVEDGEDCDNTEALAQRIAGFSQGGRL